MINAWIETDDDYHRCPTCGCLLDGSSPGCWCEEEEEEY